MASTSPLRWFLSIEPWVREVTGKKPSTAEDPKNGLMSIADLVVANIGHVFGFEIPKRQLFELHNGSLLPILDFYINAD